MSHIHPLVMKPNKVGISLYNAYAYVLFGSLTKPYIHPKNLKYPYSRSPKVGNPMASILKSKVKGIPALFGLIPVSNFLGLTVKEPQRTTHLGLDLLGFGFGLSHGNEGLG